MAGAMKFESQQPRIGIFRALQLGDMLCAVPALRALRSAFPEAEITLIGLPWAYSFAERFKQYINSFLEFPGYPGLPEQEFDPIKWKKFVLLMQDRKFDCIIQMQGKGSIVNEMLSQLGARNLAGYHCEGNFMNNSWFMEYPDHGSEVLRHLALMEHLGIPAKGSQLEFPIQPPEADALDALLPFAPDEPFVCIHPGSRGAWRQWPPANFASLGDYCASQDYKVVLTGTADEAVLTDHVQQLMKYPATDMAGKTSIGHIAAMIRQAKLLISNCTGVSHIAAAVGTRSLVFSMDGEPERWGPINKCLHKTIDCTRGSSYEIAMQQLPSLLIEAKCV